MREILILKWSLLVFLTFAALVLCFLAAWDKMRIPRSFIVTNCVFTTNGWVNGIDTNISIRPGAMLTNGWTFPEEKTNTPANWIWL